MPLFLPYILLIETQPRIAPRKRDAHVSIAIPEDCYAK